MKVALCLSGQPKLYDKGYPFLKKYFGFSEGFLSYLTLEAQNIYDNKRTYPKLSLKNKVIKHSTTDYLNWRFSGFQKCLFIECLAKQVSAAKYKSNPGILLNPNTISGLNLLIPSKTSSTN